MVCRSHSASAWGGSKDRHAHNATLVHFELPSSCRRSALYMLGMLAMIAFVVMAVVLVTRALVATASTDAV